MASRLVSTSDAVNELGITKARFNYLVRKLSLSPTEGGGKGTPSMWGRSTVSEIRKFNSKNPPRTRGTVTRSSRRRNEEE